MYFLFSEGAKKNLGKDAAYYKDLAKNAGFKGNYKKGLQKLVLNVKEDLKKDLLSIYKDGYFVLPSDEPGSGWSIGFGIDLNDKVEEVKPLIDKIEARIPAMYDTIVRAARDMHLC